METSYMEPGQPIQSQPGQSATKSLLPTSLVGVVRRFGTNGVPYEVLSQPSATSVLIRVITTGEETTYPVAHVLADPED